MSSTTGFACAFAAGLAFGVQYVPVKRYEIFDGATFQWFMCSGILLIGFAIALFAGVIEEGCSRLVILGGALWAMSNYAVLPTVKLLGIGLGFSLYHFVNLMVGYGVGRWGLFGLPKLEGTLSACDAGFVLILISFLLMVGVETADPDILEPAGRSSMKRETSSTAMMEKIASAYGLNEQEGDLESGPALEPRRSFWRRRRLLGVASAILAGVLCGIQSVPAALYSSQHLNKGSMTVVFPQCLGIWVTSTAMYLLYAPFAKLRGCPVPHATIRPAFLSGCIWTVGFAFMIASIDRLGYSIGYTLDAVGPIVVSSLLSLFYFREIRGVKQVSLYAVSFVLQLFGVVLISIFGSSQH